MGIVIPIDNKRTTIEWLVEKGFQKLSLKHGFCLYKLGELYIEYAGAAGNFFRVIPHADGSMSYVGIENVCGYACNYTNQVNTFYKYLHNKEL